MTAPVSFLLAFLGLVVSAQTRVNLPLLGPTPVLGIIALAAALGLAVAVLVLLRSIAREGGIRLRYRTVTA